MFFSPATTMFNEIFGDLTKKVPKDEMKKIPSIFQNGVALSFAIVQICPTKVVSKGIPFEIFKKLTIKRLCNS